MLRLLFDPVSYGWPNRCVPHWYETNWLWEKLRVSAALLRNVWRAIWHGRGYGRRKRIKVSAFTKLVVPLVRREYPDIRKIMLSGTPMQTPVGLDMLIKKQFGKGHA